eukprot:c14239_g1_i1.p1 GENE.c14239_g1_i1~~c14239_g1_i1.p1  ORF type:complete len:395 (+),score=74.96 c14239_g1_i1:113-1186(+)
MADIKILTPQLATAFQNMIAEVNVIPTPAFIAVMLQECKFNSAEKTKLRELFVGFSEVGSNAECDWVFGHGCNEVFIMASDLIPEAISSTGVTVDRRILYSEKSTVLASVTYQDHVLCFVGSHLKTGSEAEANVGHSRVENLHRVMELVEGSLIKGRQCDVTLWGGDFNLRTAGWEKKRLHAAFSGPLLQHVSAYYSQLSIPASGIITSPAAVNFPLAVSQKFELHTAIPYGSFADPNYDGFFYPLFDLPPTFQKIKVKNCPENLVAGQVLSEAGTEDKRAFCLPTLRGGNCPAVNPTHACMIATRPLSWTDFFLYKSAARGNCQVDKYGGYYGPSPSDHVPVFAKFIIPSIQPHDF